MLLTPAAIVLVCTGQGLFLSKGLKTFCEVNSLLFGLFRGCSVKEIAFFNLLSVNLKVFHDWFELGLEDDTEHELSVMFHVVDDVTDGHFFRSFKVLTQFITNFNRTKILAQLVLFAAELTSSCHQLKAHLLCFYVVVNLKVNTSVHHRFVIFDSLRGLKRRRKSFSELFFQLEQSGLLIDFFKSEDLFFHRHNLFFPVLHLVLLFLENLIVMQRTQDVFLNHVFRSYFCFIITNF